MLMVFTSFALVESSPKDTRITVDTNYGFSTRIKLPFSRFLSLFEWKYNVYQYEFEIYFLNESYFRPVKCSFDLCSTCEVPFLFSFSILKDDSSHCDECNFCINKRLEGRHNRRPNSGPDERCICLEVMTYSSH